MKNSNSKTFVAVGIGAALFFVLGRFVAIPSPVPNTNISLQYAVLGLLAAMYGPVAGALIGFIGHALIDLSWGGIPWWSWVIASAFTGVVVGLFAKKLNVQEGDFNKRKVATFAIANVAAHAIAWIVVAPVLDILIYAEPAKKVFAQGAFAAVSNIITAGRRRWPADSGLHQDHRQEGLSGQRVIRCKPVCLPTNAGRHFAVPPQFPLRGAVWLKREPRSYPLKIFLSSIVPRSSPRCMTSIWISTPGSAC